MENAKQEQGNSITQMFDRLKVDMNNIANTIKIKCYMKEIPFILVITAYFVI